MSIKSQGSAEEPILTVRLLNNTADSVNLVAADPNNQLATYFLGITWRNKGNEMLAKQYLDRSDQLKAAKEAMK